MVTKDMSAQIQYSSQAPEMTEYIRGVTGWTDAQLAGVNTRGLGIAKKQLPLHRSIRTTKMLYEWLNVGKQKGCMSRDHRCLGCGENNEDFQHLYHCTHPDMQEAFTQAITKAKLRLVKDGIPSNVYNGFIAKCSAAHHLHPDIRYDQSPEDVETVMGLQQQLGQASVLKGFHHIEWAYLLQSKWKPKPKPKKGSTTPPQKDALEQSVSLIRASWDVFEALWDIRNTVLHGGENMLTEAEDSSTNLWLLEFQNDSHNLLRKCERGMINQPAIDMHLTVVKKTKAGAIKKSRADASSVQCTLQN